MRRVVCDAHVKEVLGWDDLTLLETRCLKGVGKREDVIDRRKIVCLLVLAARFSTHISTTNLRLKSCSIYIRFICWDRREMDHGTSSRFEALKIGESPEPLWSGLCRIEKQAIRRRNLGMSIFWLCLWMWASPRWAFLSVAWARLEQLEHKAESAWVCVKGPRISTKGSRFGSPVILSSCEKLVLMGTMEQFAS